MDIKCHNKSHELFFKKVFFKYFCGELRCSIPAHSCAHSQIVEFSCASTERPTIDPS